MLAWWQRGGPITKNNPLLPNLSEHRQPRLANCLATTTESERGRCRGISSIQMEHGRLAHLIAAAESRHRRPRLRPFTPGASSSVSTLSPNGLKSVARSK